MEKPHLLTTTTTIYRYIISRAWWLTPAIPATREAEAAGSRDPATALHPGQQERSSLSKQKPKQKPKKKKNPETQFHHGAQAGLNS